VFDPVRSCDRLAALGAGISARQIAGIESGHGASPLLRFFVLRIFDWDT
jgi:hypothetical protein